MTCFLLVHWYLCVFKSLKLPATCWIESHANTHPSPAAPAGRPPAAVGAGRVRPSEFEGKLNRAPAQHECLSLARSDSDSEPTQAQLET